MNKNPFLIVEQCKIIARFFAFALAILAFVLFCAAAQAQHQDSALPDGWYPFHVPSGIPAGTMICTTPEQIAASCDFGQPPPDDCQPPAERPRAVEHSWGAEWEGKSVLDGVTPLGEYVARQWGGRWPPGMTLDLQGRIVCDGPCPQGRYSLRYVATAACNGKPIDETVARSRAAQLSFTVKTEAPDPEPNPCRIEPTAPGCPCPDSDRVYPLCDVEPEPEAYPEWGHWQPPIQRGYTYSEPGVCTDDHISHDAEVYLRSGERLEDALDRLQAGVDAVGGTGGVIYVSHDTKTVQCDVMKLRGRHFGTFRSLALVGIRGPSGELPRFYCRSEKRDLAGTIPPGGMSKGGTFWDKVPNLSLLEGIEVNGYSSWAGTGYGGTFVVRNGYFHGALNDGFVNSGYDWEKHANTPGRTAEYCGNNISRAGQGNVKHCFYLKRGLPGAESTYRLVDNVIHSCNFSEGFKTTGERIEIIGNQFYKSATPEEYQPTNPEWRVVEHPENIKPQYTSTQVSLVSCSRSRIEDNLFHMYRARAGGSAGGLMVQLTGRRNIQGCDRPAPPRPYIGNNVSATPDYESPFWDRSYWDSIEGEYPFSHVVRGNTWEISGPVYPEKPRDNPKGTALRIYGTYPITALSAFSSFSCLLEAPAMWRERSRVYMEGNTFIGFDLNPKTERLQDIVTAHTGYDPATGTDKPTGKCLIKGYPYPAETADQRYGQKIFELD